MTTYTHDGKGIICRDGHPFVILTAAPGTEEDLYNADMEAFANQAVASLREAAQAEAPKEKNVYTLKHELSPQAVQVLITELAQTIACRDVLVERLRQELKWGEQNHAPPIYLQILGEEYGEACQQANEAYFSKDPERKALHIDAFRAEMVQTAAVALAIVECLDRGKWKWPTT